MNVFGFKIQKINVKLRFIEETKKKSSKDIMRYNKPKWGDRYVQKGVMQFNDWQCMLGVTLPTVAEILIKKLGNLHFVGHNHITHIFHTMIVPSSMGRW